MCIFDVAENRGALRGFCDSGRCIGQKNSRENAGKKATGAALCVYAFVMVALLPVCRDFLDSNQKRIIVPAPVTQARIAKAIVGISEKGLPLKVIFRTRQASTEKGVIKINTIPDILNSLSLKESSIAQK